MSTHSEQRTLQKAATASLSQDLYFSLWFFPTLGQFEVGPLSGVAVLWEVSLQKGRSSGLSASGQMSRGSQDRRWPAEKTLALNKASVVFSFSQQSQCSGRCLFAPGCTTKLLLTGHKSMLVQTLTQRPLLAYITRHLETLQQVIHKATRGFTPSLT